MDALRYLRKSRGEVDIGRRGVHRITAKNQQEVDLAAAHILDKLSQRLEMIDRIELDRIGVGDRVADIAERLIDLVREDVHARRLLVARDHDARSLVAEEILDQGT